MKKNIKFVFSIRERMFFFYIFKVTVSKKFVQHGIKSENFSTNIDILDY